MSASVELLLFVIALYAVECLAWVRRDAACFRTFLLRGLRFVDLNRCFGNDRGVLVFGQPLPPLGVRVTGQFRPFSVSTDGVFAAAPFTAGLDRQLDSTDAYFSFDDAMTVAVEGKSLSINGKAVAVAASEGHARAWAAWLRSIRDTQPDHRERLIEQHLAASCDFAGAEKRYAAYRDNSAVLRWLCVALWVFVFLVAPAVWWWFGIAVAWPRLALVLAALLLMIAIEFRAAHRDLFPEAKGTRRLHLATMFLLPLKAIRALDLLAVDLFVGFDPLAVARAVCRPEEFRRFAGLVWRDVRFPLPRHDAEWPEAGRHTDAWFRQRLTHNLEQALRAAGLEPEDLLAPEPPESPECIAHCPRCLRQSTRLDETCSSCRDLPLAPMPTRPAAASPVPV